eukprot:PITA_01906
MQSHEGRDGVKVCVTGAGGYIASCLIKNLLQRGYTVNATLRNPNDKAKTGPLLSLPGAAERLKLFQADLTEEGAFDSAVEGCQGVFDLASPMDFSKPSEKSETKPEYTSCELLRNNPDKKYKIMGQDDFVQPALKGVLNVLKSCSRAKSVRRVVYTSSVVAASPLNEQGQLISGSTLDESNWTPVEFMLRKAGPISVCIYSVSSMIEFASQIWCNLQVVLIIRVVLIIWCNLQVVPIMRAVLLHIQDIGGESSHGLNSGQMEVVTIGPSYVGGPSIVSTFPYSRGEMLSPITGNYEGLKLNESLLGLIPLVHIEDLCEAHIFLMEQPKVQGRHICSATSLTVSQLSDSIHKLYPHFKGDAENVNGVRVPTSSKKLLDMGFSFKYGVAEILDDTIKSAQSYGLLK